MGIAISGGGHRATLFGLGVLLYLSDVEANKDVVTIASVSGGSITNAYAAINDYRTASSDLFAAASKRLAARIANRGSLFAWWGTRLYLVALVLGLGATVAIWFLPWWWVWRLVAFLVALVAWELLLVRRRGEMCGRAYAATVLGGERAPLLGDIAREGIDHVICATHLHAGEHFYLSGRFVNAYRFGWGTPGDLPLHVAVQASTALPGAFPPRWIRSSRFGLNGGIAKAPPLLGLVDGGVYDNMAEQWLVGMATRRGVPDHVQRPDTMLIANASASMGIEPVGRMHWPVVGELMALMRDASIMYDNSASIRKRDVVARFDAIAAGAGDAIGLRGCLLDITSDPYGAARAFADAASWPERAARAREILKRQPPDWTSDAPFVASVKTNLSRLGVETSARILHHAYTLAAMNLHLLLGLPLVDHPPMGRFVELCTEAS
jgi:predicted acylesterase/phospholipase RssA